MTRISLNGTDWQIKDYYGADWRWRNVHRTPKPEAGWYPAAVPGTVAFDVWQARAIPDPYFELNSRLIEWIPARTWVYRRLFTVDASWQGQRAQLRFEGVDYEAQFFLNGHDLGTHTGMYTPAVFEVAHLLNFDGDNLLVVVVAAAPPEEPQVGYTSCVRTHKSRMTYWWDFCPRMIHQGIWDDVTLDFTGDTRLTDVWVQTRLRDDYQHADVTITTALDARTAGTVTVEMWLRAGEVVISSTVTEQAIAAGTTTISTVLPVDQPRLWYPNGYGEQPLYHAEVRVIGADRAESDRRTVRFGIRQIELLPNQTDDPTARPYTLAVNGQRMYIKGWNWVPSDVMYGVPRPDKLEHLLTLAQQANVNLLRVWGGGLIEKEMFYNLCDEFGIIIWQEFIQSSSGIDNRPPDDPDFIAFMVREAEQIIPRRRNHPSLALWCGGNELTDAHTRPLDDHHPMLAALKEVVNRMDPDRLWLPTSPTGRVFGYELENIEKDPTSLHDVHGPWEYQGVAAQYTLYDQGTSLLHSEFGVEGITNLKALNATIAPENQMPVTLDSPIWFHRGAWWVKADMWRATWGEIDTIEQLVQATQLAQAEGLRYALEADRRRKYQNSGTLPWQFNEPYPMAACTSAIDYYGQPKPVYYAIAHAYESVHISARFAASAWAGHERFTAELYANNSHQHIYDEVTLSARLLDMHGQLCDEVQASVTLSADSVIPITQISTPLARITSDVFFLDLRLHDRSGETLSHNRYSFTRAENLAPLLHMPATTLTTVREPLGDTETITITNTGDVVALYLWLEDARPVGAKGYAYFADNHFCLLPQESRRITVTWQNVPAAERRLTLGKWNTAAWNG